jgi:hypothetical protein
MVEDLKSVVMLLAVISVVVWCVIQTKDTAVVKYDCQRVMSGQHPDAPVRVMKECRQRYFSED